MFAMLYRRGYRVQPFVRAACHLPIVHGGSPSTALGPAASLSLRSHIQYRAAEHPRRHCMSRREPLSLPRSIMAARMFATAAPRDARSAYEVLDVPRTASAKEIKIAYFKAAKATHPDTNPNDPMARQRFQRVSDAYAVLSDPESRRRYDQTGTGFGDAQQQQRQQQQQQGPASAQQQQQQASQADPFASSAFATDFDVVAEAVKTYATDLKDELADALAALSRGDFAAFWSILRANQTGFAAFGGILIPVGLLLRFPGIGLLIARVGWSVITHQPHVAAAIGASIWRAIVHISAQRHKRAGKR